MPKFQLRVALRKSKRVAQKTRVRPINNETLTYDGPQIAQDDGSKPKSRREKLKDTDPEKHERIREIDRLRSRIYRLEMTDQERLRSNRLTAIRQRRYRQRQKAIKEQEKTQRFLRQRRLTRSEVEKMKREKEKARDKKRRQRMKLTEAQKAEINARRRARYAEKKSLSISQMPSEAPSSVTVSTNTSITSAPSHSIIDGISHITPTLYQNSDSSTALLARASATPDVERGNPAMPSSCSNSSRDEEMSGKTTKPTSSVNSPLDENTSENAATRLTAAKSIPDKDSLDKSATSSTITSPTTNADTLDITETPSTSDDLPLKSSRSARRKRISRIRKYLPKNANQFVELLEDLQQINSPSKSEALARAGWQKKSDLKRQSLEKELGLIVAKELKQPTNRKLASLMNSLKTTRLQRYASRNLGVNRKRMLRRRDKVVGRASVPQETRRAIHRFYESKAQPLPDKRYVSRKTGKPKMVLHQRVDDLYKQFRLAHPNLRVGRTFFFKEKPTNIVSAKDAKYRGCLCEQCENIRLKVVSIDKRLEEYNLSSLRLKDTQTTVNLTLCPKMDDPFHKPECIKRTCNDCGMNLFDNHFQQVSALQRTHLLSWRRWEATKYDDKKIGNAITKRQLIVKVGSLQDAINELRKEVEGHSSHIFNWHWQAKQYSLIKKNLPDQWVLSVWDFAENYTCFHQDESQSAYWTRNQATIHPVVTSYKCNNCEEQVTESIVFISDDNKHDHDAVNAYMKLVAVHLSQKRKLQITTMVRFSDGCACQYKSKGPFADVAFAMEDYGFAICHNYFGSRHGKGPSDGESAVIKSHASTAVKSGAAVISNAWELYEYCVGHLEKDEKDQLCTHFRRSFYFVDNIERGRGRSNIKTVKGTRALHSVCTSSVTNVIKTRQLTCFCNACIMGTPGCDNYLYVGEWAMQLLAGDAEVDSLPDYEQQPDPEIPKDVNIHCQHSSDEEDADASGLATRNTNPTANNITTDVQVPWSVPDKDDLNKAGQNSKDAFSNNTLDDHSGATVNQAIQGNLVKQGAVKHYAVGEFVAVIFDDMWFPGEITKVLSDRCLINFMVPKGDNKFVWPAKKDEVMVLKSGIFTHLPCPPEPVTHRYLGFQAELSRDITARVAMYLKES